MGNIANYIFEHTVVSRYRTVAELELWDMHEFENTHETAYVPLTPNRDYLGKSGRDVDCCIREKEHRGHLPCSTAGSWRQSMK